MGDQVMAFQIIDGEKVELTPEEVAELLGSVTPMPSLPPAITPPQIVAQARLRIADWNVTGMNGNSNLGLAMPWGEGVVYCEFLTPLDNDDYIVTPTNGNTHHCYVNPDEQQPGGFLLYTEDKDGNPSFPACVQLLVTR